MKLLITGAGGLIGSFLLDKFTQLGHEVVGIDNFANCDRTDKVLDVDCSDLAAMNELCKGVDIIWHAACSPYEGFSNISPVAITNSVFHPSVVVATAAVNNDVKRIYNFSSMARYGNREELFREDMQTSPCDPYGVSKVAAENIFNVMSKIYGFEVAHIIPHNVFGNNVNWRDKRRGVINIFIVQALRGEPLTVHNDGSQRRSFSFVQDAFSFAEQLLNCELINNECFNVGPDSEDTYLSVLELAHFIVEETKSTSEISFVEKINDVKHARCSSDKIRSRFGWDSKVDVYDEIRSMIEYAKTIELKPFESNLPVEIARNCPKSWL